VESDLGNKVCTCTEATGMSVLAVTDRVVIIINCSILSLSNTANPHYVFMTTV